MPGVNMPRCQECPGVRAYVLRVPRCQSIFSLRTAKIDSPELPNADRKSRGLDLADRIESSSRVIPDQAVGGRDDAKKVDRAGQRRGGSQDAPFQARFRNWRTFDPSKVVGDRTLIEE